MPAAFARLFEARGVGDLKVDLWNAFADSDLLGINDDDCSALPRILPASYLPVVRGAARDITECLLKILSWPSRELMAVLPGSPIADYLVRELGVLRHRPRRLCGSMRFDMAIEGTPGRGNPPVLLEVNEIGFDGTGRSSRIQETLLRIFPALRRRVLCLDTAASEVRNMLRLGPRLVRFHYDTYNWEEEVIVRKARRRGLNIRIVSPDVFKVKRDRDCELMSVQGVRLKGGRLLVGGEPRPPSSFMISYSFELADYEEAPGFFRTLIRSRTPQYSPFITGLVAPKTILVVLSDRALVKRLIGARRARRLSDSILRAELLSDARERIERAPADYVMKYADGMGGQKVYVGSELRRKLRRIRPKDRRRWVIQERIDINTMDVDGFLSRRRRAIADLGVYVHYDWNGREFTHFNVGGFITRATNRSFKVNVSGGGCQVPVMFDKGK